MGIVGLNGVGKIMLFGVLVGIFFVYYGDVCFG